MEEVRHCTWRDVDAVESSFLNRTTGDQTRWQHVVREFLIEISSRGISTRNKSR